jgi:hypothetical protein
MEVQLYIFLTFAASLPCRFASNERAPATHCIGDREVPTTGLGTIQKKEHLTPAPIPDSTAIQPIDSTD